MIGKPFNLATASGVAAVTFPPAAPAIAITASTLIEGGSEVYTQLKLGKKVKWDKVLTKSIGGAVKGGICVCVPGAVATGIGIAGTATLENYLYSTISGDSSPEALSRAFINGGLEGLTAGSLKWIGNKITAKKSVKTDSKLQPVSDAELESTIGGAKDPQWNPGEGNGYPSKGYNSQPGERTLKGYVEKNAEVEKSLQTNSGGFNSIGDNGGEFKRLGGKSGHGIDGPHVHQPQRNIKPNDDVKGGVGRRTANGGVTSPSKKDVKQLYEFLNNEKYQ